jgi:hypothetical protein
MTAAPVPGGEDVLLQAARAVVAKAEAEAVAAQVAGGDADGAWYARQDAKIHDAALTAAVLAGDELRTAAADRRVERARTLGPTSLKALPKAPLLPVRGGRGEQGKARPHPR